MPPVFGPWSPSSARLKSCAAAERRTRAAVGEREERDLRPLEQLLEHDRVAEAAAALSAGLELGLGVAHEDALACREAVGLDHARRPRDAERPRAGTPAAAITSLAKLFEPSIRAAAALGPNTAMPAWRSASATPATSGASGPTTTRSTARVSREPRSPSPSSARTGWHVPRDAIPGLPGRGVQLGQRRALRELSGQAHARARRNRPGAPSRAESTRGIPAFRRCRRRRCGRARARGGVARGAEQRAVR